MEFDRTTNLKRRSFQQDTSDSSSSPKSTNSIELSAQKWLVFSPRSDQNEQDSDKSHSSPITLPYMPNHDGRGHFFNSNNNNISSSSSSQSSSEHHFSFVNHSPSMRSSFISLSEIEFENDELLSISSSISADPSISRRSSNSSSNYQHENINQSNFQINAQDTKSLLNPMEISTGLAETKKLNNSILSSHYSNQDSVVNKQKRDSFHSNKSSSSISSVVSRINQPSSIPLSSSYKSSSQSITCSSPSSTLLPNQQYTQEQENHSAQMLNFISNVAYKILDIHPDTLHLFSSSNHPQYHDSKLNSGSNHSSKNNKQKNKVRIKRFMIGDGDSERMKEDQDDEIQSPLDLSGFKPSTSSLRYYNSQLTSSSLNLSEEEDNDDKEKELRLKLMHRTDSCETFRPKYKNKKEEEIFKRKRSLSDDQLVSSSCHILKPKVDSYLHSNRSFSDENLDHLPIHSNSSSSSITGILFKKVWHEWINWEV